MLNVLPKSFVIILNDINNCLMDLTNSQDWKNRINAKHNEKPMKCSILKRPDNEFLIILFDVF